MRKKKKEERKEGRKQQRIGFFARKAGRGEKGERERGKKTGS